jgi:uncharacterized membrane protein
MSPLIHGFTLLIAATLLLWASRRLPWHKLHGDQEAWRVLLIATAVFCGLRWFNTDALSGVDLHFLGATLATLMFGPRFALWAMATASLTTWAMGSAWYGWAPDFLVAGALPVAVSHAVARGIERHLPPNLFLYVLVCGFFGGGLALAASHLAKAAVAYALGLDAVFAYLAATPPMMFGEGFLCGGAIALIVVYRPQWCASFDDARYLRPPA